MVLLHGVLSEELNAAMIRGSTVNSTTVAQIQHKNVSGKRKHTEVNETEYRDTKDVGEMPIKAKGMQTLFALPSFFGYLKNFCLTDKLSFNKV